ncbi:MAG: NUDIX domain-containing protein [Lachnospiraceae bacterium]|nr:NUDIX domain-containing protein [Lachnospiraceae bacterium]
MEREVRTSAKALVIKDGCMLAVKINDNGEEFYIMPGGGQRAGELLPDACEREVAEETGIEVKAKDAVFIIEGPEGEPFHRVDIVFLCDYAGESNAEYHGDSNQAGFEWLEIKKLNKAPLYPSKLRRPVMNLYEGKAYPAYLGKECAGDPEVTD